ncbi:bifunctional phosphoribosyl-AMP cyclohydrolase/phosphoribosyl-ATP diphosphatase HisIE [candidate division KSB1 bacterium]|nr:bifunctional phosphoribosyl-AMP cyclohydrolase/phosphoribosyl-ATP diphosphatase HisIE [candidate division KSB1 bacterium]
MIIPSIDLMNGNAVQLKQGRDKMLERDNPVELAHQFNQYSEIAVIDLDAAMNKGDNLEVIEQICGSAECRVGGGIRDVHRAKELISLGAIKVIIGTKAFENDAVNHEFLKELATAVGRRHLMIAIDAFNGEIVTKAWKHNTGLKVLDVVPELEPYISEFLFTCVEKEGGMQGTDLNIIKKISQITRNRLTVAGGITTVDELREISALQANAQLGMALYTGNLSINEAFIESLNWKNDLIPTITTDTAGQVLMLAYSSRESLQKTFETGRMWYYSRSRSQLWMKGETSGNMQDFVKFRTDCDSDALLATVRQTEAACHFDNYSCFGDKKFDLYELYDVIRERFDNPRQGSYTATLTDVKVREKLLEEAKEVVEAEEREHIIWEAADVLYFLTVLLAKSNIGIDDVLNELRRRRKK